MVAMLPKSTALLLVNVQQAWAESTLGERSSPEAEATLAALVQAFRRHALPVIHLQQDARDPSSPLFPGEPGHALQPATAAVAGELVLHRTGHCAFTGTGLEAHLRQLGIDRVVIAGYTTGRAVSSTARMACALGFKAVVVRDACVAFDLEDMDGQLIPAQAAHQAALAELHGESAMVLPAQALLALL